MSVMYRERDDDDSSLPSLLHNVERCVNHDYQRWRAVGSQLKLSCAWISDQEISENSPLSSNPTRSSLRELWRIGHCRNAFFIQASDIHWSELVLRKSTRVYVVESLYVFRVESSSPGNICILQCSKKQAKNCSIFWSSTPCTRQQPSLQFMMEAESYSSVERSHWRAGRNRWLSYCPTDHGVFL